MPNQIVVAGALIAGAALLVAQRDRPPELAGLWELPGGKVAPGESDAAGLARELHEELGVEVTVGARLGADVALNETMTLRAYRVTQTGGELRPNDHRGIAMGDGRRTGGLPWVPADRAWLADLAQALGHPADASGRSHARRRARLNTFASSLPRSPLRSALRTLCTTTGQRLQRGLLRQHFFFGLRSASLLGFK